jgi:hypothetical protein
VAALSASSAGLGALVHVLILAPSNLFAASGATIADLSTNATRVGVKLGSSEHEIGGSEADLGAVLQQLDMICAGIPSGLLLAILNGS